MQTFLPFKNFKQSAKALDNKRLNKQILEGYQILKVLNNPDPRAAWRNHPAARMWAGHEQALFTYIMAMVDEANVRGIKTDKNVANLTDLRNKTINHWGKGMPKWMAEHGKIVRVITTHKANLYRKDPEYYWQFEDAVRNEFNEPCCEACQYYWVTHEEKNAAIKG
jgi:hypothetical protein